MTISYRIPFNRPTVVGCELDYVADVLSRGHWSSSGHYCARVSAGLQAAIGVPRALLTASCSDALEMAALLLNIVPGDEVIVPTFAFVTVAGAFALRGAHIIFADIRPDTLNIDETKLSPLITPRTRAIVVIHYAGVACDMDLIMELARRHNIAVVEDCAHGPFATYKGRNLGTFGALACLSFHETKNYSCGEGGALLVNDPALLDRAEVVYEKGTDRRRFLDGQIDKYTWRDLGSSYAMSEIQAAFLCGQLEKRPEVQAARARLWLRYDDALSSWSQSQHVVRCHRVSGDLSAHHSYYLLMPDPETRTAFIKHLGAQGILAVSHYQPLHMSEMGQRHGGHPGDHPVAESIAARLVRLPFFASLSEQDQTQVIAAVTSFAGHASPVPQFSSGIHRITT